MTPTNTCRVPGIKNRGAALVLLWSFISYLMICFFLVSDVNSIYILGMSLIVSPVVGWLAEVHTGRYKMVSYGLRFMWGVAIVLNVLLILNTPSMGYTVSKKILEWLAGLGFVGVLTCTIQLGLDQMTDASSADISSYICWTVWLYALAYCLMAVSQSCFCSIYTTGLSFFLVPGTLTLTVLTDLLLHHWLIKEPVTPDPLKQIYRVLVYAAKNKYPRLRSAFTFWEDEPYSRIDLGKAKYGGPFTTEQVEDVKSFFRIIKLLLMCGIVMVVFALKNPSYDQLLVHYKDRNFVESCSSGSSGVSSMISYLSSCYDRLTVRHFHHAVIVAIVPVVELVLNPLFRRCAWYANASIWSRIIVSVFILWICTLQDLLLEVAAHRGSQHQTNATTCLFYSKKEDLLRHEGLPLPHYWILLPQTFFGVSYYLACTSAYKFIIAQGPYSMRGQLIGFLFMTFGLFGCFFMGLGIALLKLLKKQLQHSRCGVWYYSGMAVLVLLLLCLMVLIKRNYSPRRRDEDVHNQQIFAVNFFDKYLPHRSL